MHQRTRQFVKLSCLQFDDLSFDNNVKRIRSAFGDATFPRIVADFLVIQFFYTSSTTIRARDKRLDREILERIAHDKIRRKCPDGSGNLHWNRPYREPIYRAMYVFVRGRKLAGASLARSARSLRWSSVRPTAAPFVFPRRLLSALQPRKLSLYACFFLATRGVCLCVCGTTFCPPCARFSRLEGQHRVPTRASVAVPPFRHVPSRRVRM